MHVFARTAKLGKTRKNKRSPQRFSIAIAGCALISLLAGCSGTDWGNLVERRVSPINSEIEVIELPTDFPSTVPIYETAQLVELKRSPQPEFPTSESLAEQANRTSQVFTQWQTNDSFNEVAGFYRGAFSRNGWRTILIPGLELPEGDRLNNSSNSIDSTAPSNSTAQPDDSSNPTTPTEQIEQIEQTEQIDQTNSPTTNTASFLAQKDDLLVTVSIVADGDRNETKILLQYVQNNNLSNNLAGITAGNALPKPPGSSEQDQDSERSPQDQQSDQSTKNETDNPIADQDPDDRPIKSAANNSSPTEPISPTKLSDLNTVPAALQTFVKDMAKLGAIDPAQGDRLQPNGEIKRRDYARWLVLANNRIHQSNPSRQIRLALTSDKPAFADVKSGDPDFLYIQALANAGLIGNASGGNQNLFRPDAPLSREEMIAWKVPLDLRDGLPNSATVATVQQAWNFQDSDRIAPGALVAILGDDQLGDLSNIRRSFGYTTILQPKKPVTRAEAAAALWHFGTATDGISARDILQASSVNPSN
ncbi:S-layer domain-containing protein [Thalassoporum mexicanum PCC 7367]|uniref:S-layer homology domain-containing protein n=1 Tax=Thalassoporum mexicanum TaxID=3457544 RepID=UPI00029FD48F|nr:S-layer homology domain-containing protein [Pseudanabaena sp. PCC 7367]AFY68526.1 S-layer domain-containing protein [Pseudanabaena sp. PCC 7367]